MRIILLVIPNLNKYKSFTLMGDLKGHNLLLGMKHRNDLGTCNVTDITVERNIWNPSLLHSSNNLISARYIQIC